MPLSETGVFLCYAQQMEPREYIEGWVEFLGCKIDLSKHPFIPRPETEFWVQRFIQTRGMGGVDLMGQFHVLDMFTGSGCIGTAVATKCQNATVTLTDKNKHISTPLPANATFVQSSLFAKLPGHFDIILANPPYVPEGKGVLPTNDGVNIMEHEPSEALYAGKDGLSVIRPFLEQAPSHLNQSGPAGGASQIWMEFGADQKEDITNILREFNYYQNFNCTFHKDQYGVWRYIVATMV